MLAPEKGRAKRDSVPLVRTWRERAGLPTTFPLEFATPVERAMVEEIAELRETLEAILWPNRQRSAIDPRQMDIEDEQQDKLEGKNE